MYQTYAGKKLTYEQSKELMKLCLEEATYFTLLERPFMKINKKQHKWNRSMENQLASFLEKKYLIKDGEWGCYMASSQNEQEIRVRVYRITDESKEILYNLHQGIYLDFEEEKDDTWSENEVPSLTDISFWDEYGLCLLDTAAYEGVVLVYERNDTLVKFAKRNPGIMMRCEGEFTGRNENLPFGGEYQELE